MVKPKFEVTVYRKNQTPKSSIILGFSDFSSIAKLYPNQEFSVLNINTGEFRWYVPRGKNIAVFF